LTSDGFWVPRWGLIKASISTPFDRSYQTGVSPGSRPDCISAGRDHI
jgi:hypothetical protein